MLIPSQAATYQCSLQVDLRGSILLEWYSVAEGVETRRQTLESFFVMRHLGKLLNDTDGNT